MTASPDFASDPRMADDVLVLDASAVQRLLTRAFRPVSARLIIPEQAFLDAKGAPRLSSFATSKWASAALLNDTRGIEEIRLASALHEAGLTECQAAGIVIARREGASFLTKRCDAVVACAAPLVTAERIHDERDLWKLLKLQ